ncbi:uncharacterized protein LOC100892099 [Strongylocentrotus purpuratus]|uniref:Uncharacterized protein n=1 Tax=Strongylocentrotus purpuratus TaxID=7668 RepID=A0A7M7HKH3_STRPU|nr:uncharacterized protein LOC100892099 [Strongylocentrotus purpuratus]
MSDPVLGAIGVVLGVISLTFCIIQTIVMAKLYKRLSQSIQQNTRPVDEIFSKGKGNGEDDLDEVQEIAAVFSDEYDDVVNPGPCIRPVPPHKPLSYQTSNTNSLESYTNDSATADHVLISPSVADLKNSLALPLKKVFEKSCTLDIRNMNKIPEHQNQTVKSIRPRAQTSNSLCRREKGVKKGKNTNWKVRTRVYSDYPWFKWITL